MRAGLHERKDLAETDLRDLEGLGETPFEHAARLDATRLELEELTHELRREQHSDAAAAKAAAAAERLAAAGREPGWSLWLNPTPALAESVGVASVAELTRKQSWPPRPKTPRTTPDADTPPTTHIPQTP